MPIGMDFTLGETEQAVASAAAEVLDHARPPAEPGADDPALWKELARAGLLSLALPSFLGGDELGVMAVATALTEIGRRAAPVPALATLALGVLPVVRWGDRDVQQALLDGVASGDTLLTAAVREPSQVMPVVPATTARLADGAGTVSGVKVGVPCGAAADWILVPARLTAGGTGTAVVVVAGSARGLSWQRAHSAAGLARVHAAAGRGAGQPRARRGDGGRRGSEGGRGGGRGEAAPSPTSTSLQPPGRAAWPTARLPARSR